MPVLAVQDRPVNSWSSLFLVKLVVALVVKLVGAPVGAPAVAPAVAPVALLSVWFVNQVSRPILCLWVADCFGLVSVASVQITTTTTSNKNRQQATIVFRRIVSGTPFFNSTQKDPNQQKHHCCDLPNKRFNRLMSEIDMSYKMDNELKLSSELTT